MSAHSPALFEENKKGREMEGFDGLGGYEASSTTTASLDYLANQYDITYEKLARLGFRPYNLYGSSIKSEGIEKKAIVWQKIDELFGCSSSEEQEEAAKQCCSCWEYSDFLKEMVWCRGCYDLTGEMELAWLCMNCVRLCGKLDAFVMKVCGQCAI